MSMSLHEQIDSELAHLRTRIRDEAVQLIEFAQGIVETLDAGRPLHLAGPQIGADASEIVALIGRHAALFSMRGKPTTVVRHAEQTASDRTNAETATTTQETMQGDNHERLLWAIAVIAELAKGGAAFRGKRDQAQRANEMGLVVVARLRQFGIDVDALMAEAEARAASYLDPLEDGNVRRLLAAPAKKALLKREAVEAGYLVDLLFMATSPIDPDRARTMTSAAERDELERLTYAWRKVVESWSDEERHAVEQWAIPIATDPGHPDALPCPPCARALPVEEGKTPPGIGDIVSRTIGESEVEAAVTDVRAPCLIVVEIPAIGAPKKRTPLVQHMGKWRVVRRADAAPAS